jgi:hypothetical protein
MFMALVDILATDLNMKNWMKSNNWWEYVTQAHVDKNELGKE